jgi:hypothetical protein
MHFRSTKKETALLWEKVSSRLEVSLCPTKTFSLQITILIRISKKTNSTNKLVSYSCNKRTKHFLEYWDPSLQTTKKVFIVLRLKANWIQNWSKVLQIMILNL